MKIDIDADLFSIQIDSPYSVYNGGWDLTGWLVDNDIQDWKYIGGSQSGDGYTNGVANRISHYMAYNVQEMDATAFQLQFPKCKVHLFKQPDYSETC